MLARVHLPTTKRNHFFHFSLHSFSTDSAQAQSFEPLETNEGERPKLTPIRSAIGRSSGRTRLIAAGIRHICAARRTNVTILWCRQRPASTLFSFHVRPLHCREVIARIVRTRITKYRRHRRAALLYFRQIAGEETDVAYASIPKGTSHRNMCAPCAGVPLYRCPVCGCAGVPLCGCAVVRVSVCWATCARARLCCSIRTDTPLKTHCITPDSAHS